MIPDDGEEKELIACGYRFIAGIDEVGRGCLAGPVVAAAVVLPEKVDSFLAANIRDSKKLNGKQREELHSVISTEAVSIGIGIIHAEVIDEINILNATKKAMMMAVTGLKITPDYLLLDGSITLRTKLLQKAIIKGDGKCISIACASVIAKVERDRMMADYDRLYPGYGFIGHKGYGTGFHMECLNRLGPCPIHRRTFAPVKQINRLI